VPHQGGGRNSGDEHVLKFVTYNVTTLLGKDTGLQGEEKTVGLVGKGFATALDALFEEESRASQCKRRGGGPREPPC